MIGKTENPPFVPLCKRGIKGDFRIRGFIVCLALLLAPGMAWAQGGYGALHAFAWEFDQSGSPKLESTGVRALGGNLFNDNFGIEAHAASGGSDDVDYPVGSGTEEAEVELNKVLAVFARGNLPLGQWVNVFGLAGYAYGKVDVLAETTRTTESENSFAWGFGAEVALIPERLYLAADYVDYLSRSGVEASATSLGLRLSFSGQ